MEPQQKEDEIEMKNRGVEQLVAEHERIVDIVELERRRVERSLRNFMM